MTTATTALTQSSKENANSDSPLKLPPVQVTWYDDDADLFFQKQIGNFQVLSKLGSGRYGVVKSGEDTKRHIQVAIKLIAKDNLSDIERYGIKQEAQIMSFISHANIIQLYEVIENKQYICMVMEYAAGGELFDHVTRQTRLQEVEARKLFIQILDGLGYCHAHQIIHRDIKAENIFLDEKLETIKIGDWGFSTIYKAGATLETTCGSLEYAAPEILSGKPHLGPEVDVWALGVLLYFMVCGWLPFRAATDFDVYTKIKKAQYRPLPSHISDELKNFIELVLNVDHSTRPTIAEMQKHPWSKKDDSIPHYLKRPKLPRLLQLQIRQFRRNKSDPNLLSPRGEKDSLASASQDIAPIPLRFSTDESKKDANSSTKEPIVNRKGKTNTNSNEKTNSNTKTEENISTENDNKEAPKKKIYKMKSNHQISTKNRVHQKSEEKIKEVGHVRTGSNGNAPNPPKEGTTRTKASRSKSYSMNMTAREADLNSEEIKKKVSHRARKRKDSDANSTASLRRPRARRQIIDEEEENISVEPLSDRIEKPNPVQNPESAPNESTELVAPRTSGVRVSASPIRSRSPAHVRSVTPPPPTTSPTADLEPARTLAESGGSGRATPTRTKRTSSKTRSDQLLFPPRNRQKIQNSNFSVLRVDSEGLGKIQSSTEVEVLSIEQEEDQFVVVVAARAERGQEAKILELMKKFEQNATKLKRSKSQENIKNSIFAEPETELTTEEAEELERAIANGEIKPGDSIRFRTVPRRTQTWDAKLSKSMDTSKPLVVDKASINRFFSLGNEIPEITDPTILRSHSLGTPIERVLEDEDHPEEESNSNSQPQTPDESQPKEKKEKKEKKDKKEKKKDKKMKVKMFRPSNPRFNNNSGTDTPPVVTTPPEEEILIF